MWHQPFSFLAIIAVLTLVHDGTARDLRQVTEPKIPNTCTSLNASGEDDTKTIQNALDSCTKGEAVSLSSGTFNSGPITIPSGVSLLVESGVTLKALVDPKLYDLGANTCGTIDDLGNGCKALITMHGANGSGIYGEGTIDGRGSTVMTGSNISWWKLGIEAQAARKLQNNPRLIQVNDSVDITIYQITLINPPLYHLAASKTNGFTVWGININSPASGPNCDGIRVEGSQNVTMTYCNISTNGDNIGLDAFTALERHVSVLNNYFYRGNGMAIGSKTVDGISDVTVSDLTIKDANVGLYIKSNTANGGLVNNIVYENICISNVDRPINLDTSIYNLHGNHTPVFHNITMRNVKVLTNGTVRFHGMSEANPIEVMMDDVTLKSGSTFFVRHAIIKGRWKTKNIMSSVCAHAGN